ncbi:MAG: antibiotic biosynthesis monooxygenase [Bacteroidota bacterium]|nr:antibiotic biosynthesis monooxygenase [Bacteroidota bacterium]
MDVLPGAEKPFLEIFDQVKHEIRAQKGCLNLEVLSSHEEDRVSLWTISVWQSAEDLETYRTSPLFRKTWSQVKPLFANRAQAWTLTSIESVNEKD